MMNLSSQAQAGSGVNDLSIFIEPCQGSIPMPSCSTWEGGIFKRPPSPCVALGLVAGEASNLPLAGVTNPDTGLGVALTEYVLRPLGLGRLHFSPFFGGEQRTIRVTNSGKGMSTLRGFSRLDVVLSLVVFIFSLKFYELFFNGFFLEPIDF
jgi:hypothetical protein